MGVFDKFVAVWIEFVVNRSVNSSFGETEGLDHRVEEDHLRLSFECIELDEIYERK